MKLFSLGVPSMHICEFCHTSFRPRAQVKHPRACSKCQKARQRANEDAWHERNPKYSDKLYHLVQKKQRMKRLGELVQIIVECLRVGKDFLRHNFDLEKTRVLFSQFLADVGIREINKFWKFS